MTRITADPQAFVADAMDGFLQLHSGSVRGVDGGVVRMRPRSSGSVAVVIGGGSGHYPAFAGYVGPGMAAGAVCGNVFTSPSSAQALRVAEAADTGGGVLFTFGQYAGDVLHFGAAERTLRERGVDARTVLITDDVASAPADNVEARRGIAGIVCVWHIAGAAADRGYPIDDVERLARIANDRTRTMGVAFGGCTLPGTTEPLFQVPPGSMSIGLGIHGEPGVQDVPMQAAPELALTLVEPLMAERPDGAIRAVVLLNGLGSIGREELFVLYAFVSRELAARGVEIIEPECGELVTSLDMAGVSLTLMWLTEELEDLWSDAAHAPGFVKAVRGAPVAEQSPEVAECSQPAPIESASSSTAEPVSARSRAYAHGALGALRAAQARIRDNEAELGRLDAVAGDGDHGSGMVRGITAAVERAEKTGAAAGVAELLGHAGEAWSDIAGGTSGALWGALLREVGAALDSDAGGHAERTATAVTAARTRLEELGGAAVGDKTMMDALIPFERSLIDGLASGFALPQALRAAADVARQAAEETRSLRPRLGRARPLAERSVGHPDPGAVSLSMIADAVVASLSEES